MRATLCITIALLLSSCGGEVRDDRVSLADKCRRAEVAACAACDGSPVHATQPACQECSAACAGSGCGLAGPVGGNGGDRAFCVVGCDPLDDAVEPCPGGYVCAAYKTELTQVLTACFPEEFW